MEIKNYLITYQGNINLSASSYYITCISNTIIFSLNFLYTCLLFPDTLAIIKHHVKIVRVDENDILIRRGLLKAQEEFRKYVSSSHNTHG